MLEVDVPIEMLHGEVDEGYGAVADEFRRNFAERAEIGAHCVVYRDGRKVVDLWGGYRDGRARRLWERDTLVPVSSTTAGVASMTLALARSRGLLDFDARVADYWPEFAAAGKQDVTVRALLSHQAGLPAVDQPLDLETLGDLDALADVLAAQAPAWEPGTHHGYHRLTLGWYEGELIRRVDPGGRSLGRYFAEEIAQPWGIDFHIGLPLDVDPVRVATIHGFSLIERLAHLHELPPRLVLAFVNPRSLTSRSFANPSLLRALDDCNRADVRRLQIPSGNGVGQVRAIAFAYGELATAGGGLGIDPATVEALAEPARPPSDGPRDRVLHVDTAFSLGYVKPFPRLWFGTAAGRAFGTMGAGGSFGFADPDAGIGFAYAMNRAGFRLWGDPREVALRDALYRRVLDEAPQRPD